MRSFIFSQNLISRQLSVKTEVFESDAQIII